MSSVDVESTVDDIVDHYDVIDRSLACESHRMHATSSSTQSIVSAATYRDDMTRIDDDDSIVDDD